MLTVAIPKRNKLQNIIVLTPKDGTFAEWFPEHRETLKEIAGKYMA